MSAVTSGPCPGRAHAAAGAGQGLTVIRCARYCGRRRRRRQRRQPCKCFGPGCCVFILHVQLPRPSFVHESVEVGASDSSTGGRRADIMLVPGPAGPARPHFDRGALPVPAVFGCASTAITRFGCACGPGLRCYKDINIEREREKERGREREREGERVDSAWRRAPLFRCDKHTKYIYSAPLGGGANMIQQKQSPPRAPRRPRRHCRFT